MESIRLVGELKKKGRVHREREEGENYSYCNFERRIVPMNGEREREKKREEEEEKEERREDRFANGCAQCVLCFM